VLELLLLLEFYAKMREGYIELLYISAKYIPQSISNSRLTQMNSKPIIQAKNHVNAFNQSSADINPPLPKIMGASSNLQSKQRGPM
jgi:hypothetical protein